jgi:NADH:ubiquinone oxidoreductase subunit 3 (subunit A)
MNADTARETVRDAFDSTATAAPITPTRTSSTSDNVSRKALIVAIVFLVVLIALIALAVWALSLDPVRTANIRDIVLIIGALGLLLVNIGIGVLMIVLIYRLQDLIHLLRNEIKPTLGNVTQTVRTVTGTARMVSDNVAGPVIRAAGIIAGLRQVARSTRRKVDRRR